MIPSYAAEVYRHHVAHWQHDADLLELVADIEREHSDGHCSMSMSSFWRHTGDGWEAIPEAQVAAMWEVARDERVAQGQALIADYVTVTVEGPLGSKITLAVKADEQAEMRDKLRLYGFKVL